MKRVCFYHSADNDGCCSGAIVRKAFEDVILVGWDYGDPIPFDLIDKNTDVFLVDLTFQPFSEVKQVQNICNHLTIIDHHKTAIEDIKQEWANGIPNNVTTYTSTEKAACELCWEFFFPKEQEPRIVNYIGRWDVWDWHGMEGSKEIEYALKGYNTKPDHNEFWKPLLGNNPADVCLSMLLKSLLNEGKLVIRHQKLENEKIVKTSSFETKFEGLRFIACNHSVPGNQLFNSVYDSRRHDAMLIFRWVSGMWTISMYSTKDSVDVSNIAKQYGGGGHAKAAGFRYHRLPFRFNQI